MDSLGTLAEALAPDTCSLGPALAVFLNIQQFSSGLEASFEAWFCHICGFSDSILIDYCAHHKMTEKYYPQFPRISNMSSWVCLHR